MLGIVAQLDRANVCSSLTDTTFSNIKNKEYEIINRKVFYRRCSL